MSFLKSFFKLAQINPAAPQTIEELIRQGNLDGSLDFPDSIDNQSILSYAVSVKSRPDTVEKLIRIGVSTHYPYGVTPFEAALDADSPVEVFTLLIDHGILHHSVSKPPLVRQLVEKEDIDEKKQAIILNYLLKSRSIDLNDPAFLDAPLVLTAYKKQRKVLVFLLLKFGADIKSIYDEYYAFFDEEMKKNLSKALLENQPEDSFEYFLPHLNFEDFKTYLTALESAKDRQMILLISKNARLSNREKAELGKIAIIKGGDVNEISHDVFGTTALQYYGECYHIGTDTVFADFLFDNGAVLDLNKKSPLLHVVLKNDIEFVKYLIRKGADPNALTHRNNAIINAFISSRYMDTPAKKIRMLELLLDNGLDINLKSRYFQNDEYPRSTLVDILINKKDEAFLEHVLNACNGIEIRGDEICDAIAQELCDGVCRLLIDKKPDYTATAYYSHKVGDETYTYDAQSLEIAISYNRESLADYLIDNYPGMKAHCDHKSLIEKAYKEGFSLNFIEKLIQRDPDINRIYYCTRNDPSYDGQMTTTETTLIRILTLLKRKDAVLDEICEIVRLLLEHGADANIPLTKLNISESYTDEEGTLLYAMDTPGDVRLLDLLIDKGGVDPNRPISRHNQSQIHAMFSHRGLEDEDVLFNLKYFDQKCGLNLAQVDKNNTDLLLEAASNCRPQSLQFLLEKGAKIDVIGGFDNSPPLHKAISNLGFLDRSNRARTVEVLIGAGTDMAQFDSEQFTPLMSACHYGCYESAAVLLENGVDPNHENELGQSAANVIIQGEYSYDDPDNFEENKSRIFALLKEHGCRVDNVPQQGSIVLCDAIGYGYKTIFNTLLQLGLDINQKDARDLAPVMVAVQFGDIYFCNRLLKDETLDVTCRDQAGETLIHKAVRREDPETAAALIAYFIEKGVKAGLLSHGMDILGFAAYFCRHELLTPLLACAPDINNTADNGFTPLFWALCSNENINEDLRGKTMEKLTALGADPGVTDADGKSLLHWAVMAGRNTLIPFIIGLGADVNATDATGYSPLCQLVHIAFNQEDFDMAYFTQTAKILVENGAQVDRAMVLSKQSDGESQITQVLENLKK